MFHQLMFHRHRLEALEKIKILKLRSGSSTFPKQVEDELEWVALEMFGQEDFQLFKYPGQQPFFTGSILSKSEKNKIQISKLK